MNSSYMICTKIVSLSPYPNHFIRKEGSCFAVKSNQIHEHLTGIQTRIKGGFVMAKIKLESPILNTGSNPIV